MARSIKCPHCGQVMKVGEHAAGKRVDCPTCKKAFLAPRAIATPAKPAAGPPPAAAPTRIWYVHIEGRNDGPHSPETVIEQLKTGKLDAHTLAWKEGMGDWQPLSELQEFRGAFAAPPPVTKHLGHKPHERGAEHEPRAHYSRSKARLDLMVGLWVAGGLAVAALVAVLINLSRKDDEPLRPPRFTAPPIVAPVPPTTATQPGTTVIHGPRPLDPPKKAPKAEVPNTKLLSALVADLDRGFKDAIVAHTKAMPRPILKLSQALKSHAEKLAERDWRPYKDDVDALVKRLSEASSNIQIALKERADGWGLGEGLDEKKKAEILELHKFDWLTNWQKILAEEVAKLRKKGMEF